MSRWYSDAPKFDARAASRTITTTSGSGSGLTRFGTGGAEATGSGAVEDLEQLHASGTDVNSLDHYGQTGLMLAAVRGRHETVEWLVAHGADLDHTAKYHLSAVMLAVIYGHVPTS